METKIYRSADVADMCQVQQITVQKWAQKNGVSYIGEGKRKTYLFTAEDIERFRLREKPGRRWT
jgi:DNA-binding transcriptional MerR regulator